MKDFAALIAVAILIEGIVEIVKLAFNGGKPNKSVIASIVVGILFAFTVNLDILAIIGLDASIPYVGVVATGILVSRGANFVHDLQNKLTNQGE